jgi:AcrR family transcriptional regulator
MPDRSDGRKRREDIVTMTAQALLEQGMARTTTRDVARRLGIGAGLINHYFAFSDLRAAAFVHAVTTTMTPTDRADPTAVMDEFFAAAFAPALDGLWRLWVEATDLSGTDDPMRQALAQCTALALDGLTATIATGTAQGAWRIADAESTAIRLLALHEGLVGFVLSGLPAMPRDVATAHLQGVFDLHCRVG